jgi:hypothetical protein
VLKPLLLGRGSDVPTVVIFIGAIGGFMRAGFEGEFPDRGVISSHSQRGYGADLSGSRKGVPLFSGIVKLRLPPRQSRGDSRLG